MQYVTLGNGPIPVVVIPGAGDGLNMVGDAAWRLAWFYRRRAQTDRLLVISRRQPIPLGYTVEQHASDYLWALDSLGVESAIVECKSAGGPIGRWLAVKRPDLARGLILSATLHRMVEHTRSVLLHWRQLAIEHRWAELQWSSIEYTFRPSTVGRYRVLKPLLWLLSKPRYPERLVRIFDGLLDLDNCPILPRIACPTLVIGGADDRVIPADVQHEMANLIPGSRVILYPGYGHANDQENRDYEIQARRFMREVWFAPPPHSGTARRPAVSGTAKPTRSVGCS